MIESLLSKMAALLALGAVGCAAAGVPGPVTQVRDWNGVPTFFMDGRPFTSPVFTTYVPQRRYFRQFADAGVKVHMFSISLGPCMQVAGGRAAPMWIGPDQWDFSQLEERVRNVLEADPEALLFPRFYVDTPDWWLSHNVSECQVLDTGLNYYTAPTGNSVTTNHLFASLASETWRQAMADGIRHVIAYIQSRDYADRIFGYFITGLYTEEFYHWSSKANQLADYSEPFTQGFRRYLRHKYGSDAALQSAWREVNATLDTVRVPSKQQRMQGRNERTFRSVETEMPVIDYYLYYNEVMPETIEVFCRAAKEASGGKKVVGAFYGFMYEFGGDPEFGHNALNRFLRSEAIDYMVVTASYHNRRLGDGADYVRSPAASVLLNGKLWYHDNDTMSFLYRQAMGWREDMSEAQKAVIESEARRIGAPTTLEDTLWQYQRTAGFSLACGFYQSFFDLHGGYFDHPALMQEVQNLTAVLEDSHRCDRRSAAEILVVADETSPAYATYDSQWVANAYSLPQVAFTKIGAPHDSILIDDLDKIDPSRYKLVIFLNTFHLTDAQRRAAERLKSDGRMLLWTYAPGLFNGSRRNPADMETLTGIRIVEADDGAMIDPGIQLDQNQPFGRCLAEQGIERFSVGSRMAQLFYVEDPDARTLGVLPDSDKAVLAAKTLPGYTALYSITPILPAAVYRRIARDAGVFIYNDRSDSLYLNKSYLTLNADGDGTRTIVFPARMDIIDPLSGQTLYRGVDRVQRMFKDKETLLVRIAEYR